MKKYSFEKLDHLLKGDAMTIKTKEIKKGTLYLDALNNGEFAVSLDDFNLGIFPKITEACRFFDNFK